MLSDIANAVGLATVALFAAVIITLTYAAGRWLLSGGGSAIVGPSPWARVLLLTVGVALVAGVAAALWGPAIDWQAPHPVSHWQAVFVFWAVFLGVPAFGAAFAVHSTPGVRRFAGAALTVYGMTAGASIGYAGAAATATPPERVTSALIWGAIGLLAVAVALYQTSRSFARSGLTSA